MKLFWALFAIVTARHAGKTFFLALINLQSDQQMQEGPNVVGNMKLNFYFHSATPKIILLNRTD